MSLLSIVMCSELFSFSRGTYNPMGTTDQGLVQRQQDVIKEQDETLAQIESGVGRLHEKVRWF